MDKYYISLVSTGFGLDDGRVFEIRTTQVGVPVPVPEWVQKHSFFQYYVKQGMIRPADEGEAGIVQATKPANIEASETPANAEPVVAEVVTIPSEEVTQKSRKRKADA